MSSQILKLRETESSNIVQNGDYSITLNKPITLVEGDRVSIKSVYLDTIASSGQFIELVEDVPIQLEVAKYLTNLDEDQNRKKFTPAALRAPSALGDFDTYLLCTRTTTGANTFKCDGIHYNVLGSKHSGHIGPVDFFFEYAGVDGKKGTIKMHIDTSWINIKGKNKVYDVDVRCVDKSVVLTSDPEYVRKHGIDPKSLVPRYKDQNVDPNLEVCDLRTMPFDFTVPKGIYSPDELGALITDEMTKIDQYQGGIGNNIASNAFPVNNPFLTTILQDQIGAAGHGTHTPTHPDGTAAGANPNQLFCRADGLNLMKFDIADMRTANEDRFLGANEIALVFDQNHKKMAFQIAHFPMYVNATGGAGGDNGLPGIVYKTQGTESLTVKRYSGVAFTKMLPEYFWQDYLGFTDICLNVTHPDTQITDDGVFGFNCLPVAANADGPGADGISVTTGYMSLDTPVQKNDNFRIPSTANSVATDATTPILGNKTFVSDVEMEGYYLCELDFGVQQSFIGGENQGWSSNKINSIVSSYYQQGGFTADQGSGSIAYVHKGLPMDISNFHIRILNSEGKVPSTGFLGPKNNVFVEIDKVSIN